MEDNFKVLKELCHLLCCPPKLSHIVAKISFFPPEPTYAFTQPANSLETLITKKNFDLNPAIFRAFYVYTKEKSQIACTLIKANPNSDSTFTILYSHGNAVDIGLLLFPMEDFARQYNVDVLVYDYSGYGISTGKTLEKNLYSDSEAVFNYMTSTMKLNSNNIILYGQSIGTVPTVRLATKYKCAAMILHSPLESGLKVLCPDSNIYLLCDPFRNIDRISKVQCYGLIIHGEQDDIIPIIHGKNLYEKLKFKLQPLWVEDGKHNDIEPKPEYKKRMDKFFISDLIQISKNQQPIFDPTEPVTSQPVWTPNTPKSKIARNISQSINNGVETKPAMTEM